MNAAWLQEDESQKRGPDRQVGQTGYVEGGDMTLEMVEEAQAEAQAVLKVPFQGRLSNSVLGGNGHTDAWSRSCS